VNHKLQIKIDVFSVGSPSHQPFSLMRFFIILDRANLDWDGLGWPRKVSVVRSTGTELLQKPGSDSKCGSDKHSKL